MAALLGDSSPHAWGLYSSLVKTKVGGKLERTAFALAGTPQSYGFEVSVPSKDVL